MKKLKLSNQTEILVDDNEIETILNAIRFKDKIVALRRGVFNSSYFVTIVDTEDEPSPNSNMTGTLHDGLQVIRYFGSWYVDGEFDDSGKPYKHIDSTYYKEVARDCVPSRKEYQEKYAHLPKEERLKLILKGSRPFKIGEPEKLSNLLLTDENS